jgi:ferritin
MSEKQVIDYFQDFLNDQSEEEIEIKSIPKSLEVFSLTSIKEII